MLYFSLFILYSYNNNNNNNNNNDDDDDDEIFLNVLVWFFVKNDWALKEIYD